MLKLARLKFNYLPIYVLYNSVPQGHNKVEGGEKITLKKLVCWFLINL